MSKPARMTTKLKISRRELTRRLPRWSRLDLITLQDRWWVDAHGDVKDVNKITKEYQRNLLNWLLENAPRFKYPYELVTSLGGVTINGDIASEIYESMLLELYELDPQEWMEETPLVKRLRVLTKQPRPERKLDLADIRLRYGSRMRNRREYHRVDCNPSERIQLSREARFKDVIRALIREGHDPSPSNIYYCIYKASNHSGQHARHNMDGKECRWRREQLEELGWTKTKDGPGGRWTSPFSEVGPRGEDLSS